MLFITVKLSKRLAEKPENVDNEIYLSYSVKLSLGIFTIVWFALKHNESIINRGNKSR